MGQKVQDSLYRSILLFDCPECPAKVGNSCRWWLNKAQIITGNHHPSRVGRAEANPEHVPSAPETLLLGLHEHYKGGKYVAVSLARHHESRNHFVVYISQTTGAQCIREYATEGKDSWTDLVNWPDGQRRPRFRYLENQPK